MKYFSGNIDTYYNNRTLQIGIKFIPNANIKILGLNIVEN